MPQLLIAHLAMALAAPALVNFLGRRAFLVLALAPASAAVYALTWTSRVMRGEHPVSVTPWIDALGLNLVFRMDTLSWFLLLISGGVGAVVLVYCSSYFSANARGTGRFAAVLTAFAGAMVGLVTADDMLLLFVFWELTTVFSYLLIGHYADRKSSRRAAMQAIVVTTFGGLSMLGGIVVLGETAGTYLLSEVLAAPPTGSLVTVAVVLMLVGAVTKSALLPFHFWLPGAMAAPTPVSAYLHAAAMVKAGVYLVARLAPGFADLDAWRVTVIVLGAGTLLLGGYRALRQNDLKLVLAFGTVSQLGFIILLVGLGTRSAALAGLAMIGAHAMFKAALFLVTGVVDAATGTRDLRRLTGVGRRLPLAATAGGLAIASMIGLPPLAGYVAKEGALESLVHDGVPGAEPWVSVVLLAAVVVGSMLTFAYGLRFWWGAFASKAPCPAPAPRPVAPGEAPPAEVDVTQIDPAQIHAQPRLLVWPPLLLAVLGLAAALVPHLGEDLLAPHAALYPAGEAGHLTLWGGVGPAFWSTVAIVAAGTLLFVARRRVEALQSRMPHIPEAERVYRRFMRRLDEVAADVTSVTQRGSLPLYLGIILGTLVIAVGGVLVADGAWPEQVVLASNPGQVLVAGVTAVAAVLAARARRRLKAVLLVGVTGYGTAVLFMLHGAPDLALTQVLVETITLVVFVLALRRLPAYFSDRPLASSRFVRLGIAIAVGVTVAAMALTVPGARIHEPVSVDFPEEVYVYGGGKNIVNVVLVDTRAWDTMGEISVLLVAATGVASLVFLRRRSGEILRAPQALLDRAARAGVWLRGGRTLAPQRRSVVFEVATRLLFHSMIVFAAFLLFSGHNAPGGGFAAGLVTGIAIIIRYLAAGRYELGEAAPIHPGLLLGTGLFLSVGVGLVPVLFGGEPLQSFIVQTDLPLLGHVKLVTSVFFDLGVFLVVIGLVLDILRSLGAEIDRQTDTAPREQDGTYGAAAVLDDARAVREALDAAGLRPHRTDGGSR
ncbi:Na+/H+ antiporter subunit A [Flavimobilis sp. GY10621]|uniref:Na+/H+ antiporter subunit A n=1 Tax=Flavimobilis rhizosphaerae TaxID=2775421 RepID=A0ABR9DL88_9MICO|nr:Na+/H+ antiporter subunit A [Flavimobilis rhizosphaerae]MBD9697907.1 Na+/H+ antiporter subunit A [Flavimobilis rhizosphaerae]